MLYCLALKNILHQHHILMEKALITLTARVVRAHREMAPCIARIHTGFMVETNIDTVEKDLQQLQEMLRQIREAQKAPPRTYHSSNVFNSNEYSSATKVCS